MYQSKQKLKIELHLQYVLNLDHDSTYSHSKAIIKAIVTQTSLPDPTRSTSFPSITIQPPKKSPSSSLSLKRTLFFTELCGLFWVSLSRSEFHRENRESKNLLTSSLLSLYIFLFLICLSCFFLPFTLYFSPSFSLSLSFFLSCLLLSFIISFLPISLSFFFITHLSVSFSLSILSLFDC